jgi:hypothetical protein
MPPAGFLPAIPASEQPETYASVSAVTLIGIRNRKKICGDLVAVQDQFTVNTVRGGYTGEMFRYRTVYPDRNALSPNACLVAVRSGRQMSPFNIIGMNVLEPPCGDRGKEWPHYIVHVGRKRQLKWVPGAWGYSWATLPRGL